jgi:hypothetical protein
MASFFGGKLFPDIPVLPRVTIFPPISLCHADKEKIMNSQAHKHIANGSGMGPAG